MSKVVVKAVTLRAVDQLVAMTPAEVASHEELEDALSSLNHDAIGAFEEETLKAYCVYLHYEDCFDVCVFTIPNEWGPYLILFYRLADLCRCIGKRFAVDESEVAVHYVLQSAGFDLHETLTGIGANGGDIHAFRKYVE